MPFALLLLVHFVVPVQSDYSTALESVLTPAERRDYVRAAVYPERSALLGRVLDRRMLKVARLVKSGASLKAREPVRAIGIIAGAGDRLTAEVSERKSLRSRQARRLEIRLRKMLERLEALKREASHQAWDDFDATIEEVQNFRSRLLRGFFAGRGHPPLEDRYLPVSFGFAAATFAPGSGMLQRRGESSVFGDQFTDEEHSDVQDAQELKKRVKVFLEIAEARLKEIDRRLQKQEWDKKKANPLEFYTYPQLVRAYHRALRSSMINIDEKARHRLASEKDIKKVLESLNGKMQGFIPRLEPLRQVALDLQDEDFFLEWREAWKATHNALKGSQFGLGAPAAQDN